MKLSSTLPISPNLSLGPVRAELVASSGGKSLVMLNGMPVQVDTDLKGNAALAKSLAQKGGASQSSLQVSPERLLAESGIEKNETSLQLIETMREFGVPLNSENLGKAVAAAAAMPSFALNRAALSAVVLLLLKRLPVADAGLIHDYLSGKLKFAGLFARSELLRSLLPPESASLAEVLQKLQQMLSQRGRVNLPGGTGESIDDLSANLYLQELLSSQGGEGQENRLYFQWPLFWSEQSLPDTLEGEASFAGGGRQGFCLRLLLNPPTLGQIEVAMNCLDNALWVHFGVATEVIDEVQALFPGLQGRLEASGFAQVRLTIGKIREIESFFLVRLEETAVVSQSARVDVKV